VPDPTLWHRASYARPVTLAWPDAPVQQVCRFNATTFGGSALAGGSPAPTRDPSAVGEVPVWACIGQCYLRRNEPQLALVALKRAEAWASSNEQRDELRLTEAEALIQLGQPGAATALLLNLAQEAPRVGSRAQALLGAVKLQQGAVRQGLALLRRAVEEDKVQDWPGRAQAEANLGLAYFMSGDEAAGFRWLHAAQQRFAAAHDTEQLRQCLENEAGYLEKKGKSRQAAAVRDRLRGLEAR